MSELQRAVEVARALASRSGDSGLLSYLGHVTIDSSPEPRPFRDIAEQWQWDLAASYAPRLDTLAGIKPEFNGPESFWYTLPRGHDKTSSIGRAINFLLRYSRRPLDMIVAAKDEEQAGIVLDCMVKESRHNAFLSEVIEYGRRGATGPGGRLTVMAGDARGSTGLNPDLILLDELTQWQKRDMFDSLWSGRQKRPGSVLIVITNAGELRSWQWDFLQTMRSSRRWFIWECPPGKQLATWQTPEVIEEVRKTLPPGIAKRMIDNIWIDPSEESGWVTYAEALACFDPLHLPSLKAEPGVVYKAGIDYGPKKDRTALSICHRVGDDRIVVDHLSVWQGGPSSPVRIVAVEDWIDEMAIKVYNADLVVDPYQMESTIQKYEHTRLVQRFESRGGKANYEMAECLRGLLIHRRIKWGPLQGCLTLPDGSTETFTDELSRLIVKPMSYGYRFDHTVGQHDDRTVSVGMAALELLRDQTQGGPIQRPPNTDKPPRVWSGNPIRPGLEQGRGYETSRNLYGVNFGEKSWRQSI